MKEIKEELNKWRGVAYPWIGRLTVVHMSVIPNLIYRFNAIPVKIPVSYYEDLDKLILKYVWRGKRHRTAKTILKEKRSWRNQAP